MRYSFTMLAVEASGKRLCRAHIELRDRLQAYSKKRRELTELDWQHPGHAEWVSKLKQLQKEAEASLLRSQDLTKTVLSTSSGALSIGTHVFSLNNAAEPAVTALGATFRHFGSSSASQLKCIQDGLAAPYLLWYSDDEHEFVFGELTLFSAVARLIGGGCGGPAWLHSCQAAGMLLPPVLELQRSLDVSKRLFFHKTLEDSEEASARAICLCLKAATELGFSHGWAIHKKWKHV